MKKLIGFMMAAVFIMGAAILAGCGAVEDDYYVYEVSKYTDYGLMEYDIVYYDTRSNYNGEVLTGFVDESHFNKANWTEDKVKQTIADAYPGISEMSFVKSSLTDEGDYYCSIVAFNDLDKLDNLTTLYQHGTLFSTSILGKSEPDPNAKAEELVGTMMFKSSIGGTQVKEDDIEGLGLHYFASKKS